MPPFKPIPAGTRAGRLVVLEDRQRGDTTVRCQCDCGTEKIVSLKTLGTHTHSCGCIKRERVIALKLSHGMAGTRIYNIWAEMVARCTRPTHKRYKDYGGRGITVCDRWRDFSNFYADMGDRPEGRSLDRINNNGPYSPDNCRWATASEQANNKRGFGIAHRISDPETGRFLPGTSTTERVAKSHCKRGHAKSRENTYVNPNTGKKACRPCVAEHARARRAAAA